MKNNKGFTLVEILAAVTILGVLAVLSIGGYARYAEAAKKKAHDTMAKSASNAAEQYVIDNPGIAVETVKGADGMYKLKNANNINVTFKELIEENYMNSAVDPDSKDKNCTGKVTIGLIEAEKRGALDRYIFIVDECCITYKARYTYTYLDETVMKDGQPTIKTTFKEIKDLNNYSCS